MRRDPDLAHAVRRHVLDHKREVFAAVIARAVARGESPRRRTTRSSPSGVLLWWADIDRYVAPAFGAIAVGVLLIGLFHAGPGAFGREETPR